MLTSNLEKDFVLEGLRCQQRLDGRGQLDPRRIEFEFGNKDTTCLARLGDSVAFAAITASLEQPFGGRPSEGTIQFTVGIAKAQFKTVSKDPARVNQYLVELGRFVERSFRESKAVDLESLCVQAGRRVWHIQVDIKILGDDGNIPDVVGLAALGALRAFRRPEVTLDPQAPGGLRIHSLEDREGIALTLHHFPVSVSFSYFDEGVLTVVDATSVEESAANGTLTVAVTPQGELCAVQKANGCGITQPEIMRCIRIAIEIAKETIEKLESSIKAHEVARVAARVRRQHVSPSLYHGPATSRKDKVDLDLSKLPENIKSALDNAEEPLEDMDEEDIIAQKVTCIPDDEPPEQGKEDVENSTSEDEEMDPIEKQRRYATKGSNNDPEIYAKTSKMIQNMEDAGNESTGGDNLASALME
eukprot:jgi/Picsp_1/3545/NSC_06383-R1_ribonuclease ph45a